MRFLRENWLWVAVPFFAVLLLFVLFLFLSEGEQGSPFTYSIF